MNQDQRNKLNDIIKNDNDFKDNTNLIRDLKHSELLKLEIEKMIIFKNKNKLMTDESLYNELLKKECLLLFTHYKDIYNKLKNDNIDVSLLFEMIGILKEIEDGKLDQNEASFKIGTILKQIYVDTALDNIPEQKQHTNISYSEWKNK